MADVQQRTVALRGAAQVLADDAAAISLKLRKQIGEAGEAEKLAGALQRLARDTKWILQRLKD